MAIAASLFANDGGRSGIGRYMKALVPALVAADPGISWHFYVAQEDVGVFADVIAEKEASRVRLVPVANRWNAPPLSLLWHAFVFDRAARAAGADAIYLPAGNRRLVAFGSLPRVAVVHDLSSFHVKGKYDPLRMFYIKGLTPWLIRRATRVIAISTSTAKDVVELAKYPAERITLIGNGYDRSHFAPMTATAARARLAELRVEVPQNYLLYVSRLEHPGKNHVGLLKGYRALLDRNPDFAYDLVFAGGRWNGAEAVDAAIAELRLANRVHLLGFVDDRSLPPLYAAARALLFPSLFEGFGLPVIESQACGIPVAGANASSIPEVIGDAGLLFDPHDANAIADAVERIASDEALRSEVIARGFENSRRFTWESAAERTVALLREVADGKRSSDRR